MNCSFRRSALAAAWFGLFVCAARPGTGAEGVACLTVDVAALAPIAIIWRKLPADPAEAEVQRKIAITQPLLWIK